MLPGDTLFTRRQFLQTSAAALAVAGVAPARETTPVKIGQGKATFTLDSNWGELPAGMKYGLGCAIVVDAKDRVIVTSRSTNPCVAIFDPAAVQDHSTWDDPAGYATGIEHVFVNGERVLNHGRPNGKLAGRYLPFGGPPVADTHSTPIPDSQ